MKERRVLLAILSGLALYSSSAPLSLWPGALAGSAFLILAIRELSLRDRFLLSFIAGISYFLPLLHWSGAYVGAIPWLILAIGEGALFSLVALYPLRRDFTSYLGFSFFFVLIELLRMKFPFGGFGWGRLGFTQVDSLGFLYPIVGVTGISLVITLVAAFLITRPMIASISLISLLLLNNFVAHSTSVSKTNSVSVLAIQGGVDHLGLDFNSRAYRVLKRHSDETLKAFGSVKDSDLVVWPENSSDIDPIRDTKASSEIANVIRAIKRPLLVGAVESSAQGPQNSSILFDSQGKVSSRYIKQDLAPFGEYIPLRTFAEFISNQARSVTNFIPGKGWVFHTVTKNGKSHRFASIICFEVLDDDLIRSAVKAEFFIAQTNNATFGRTPQAAQQLQITQARAAELSKSIMTVSTTGFTSLIARNGEIAREIPQFSPGYLQADVEMSASKSFAARFGSVIWIVILSLGAGLCLWSRRSVFTR